MVIYTGSPAGDLRITAELWVNEAFVPAVSCHDAFEQSGIVFRRAPCARTRHTPSGSLCAHTFAVETEKIHQSLSHAEAGSLKEGVSFLSLPVALSLSLSSISFSVSARHTHLSLSLSVFCWSSPCCLTFLGSSSCLQWAGSRKGVRLLPGPARWRGLSWDWRLGLGENPLAILVTVAADMSSVGRKRFHLNCNSPQMLMSRLWCPDRWTDGS